MRKKNREAGKTRVRWTLLALLWAWAIVTFMVVDLYFDVEEFDGVRPRSSLYRGMRRAAHRMVGTPYRDPAEEAASSVAHSTQVRLAETKPEPRGRVLHRYLPRRAESSATRHGTYAQWTDPPGARKGDYEDKMRHGTWSWYWASGSLREQREYQRGVLHGTVTEWYKDGQKKAEEDYQLGKPVGVWRTWHPDGTLASKEPYDNGALHGKVQHWHADGSLAAEASYDHGAPRGKLTAWHANGKVKETGFFKDGKREGVWLTYASSGDVVSQVLFRGGKKIVN